MNVFEERGVKAGDYVEFTVNTNATYKYDGVTVETVRQNTYKGNFDRMETGRIILEGEFPVFLAGEVTLNVLKRAEPPREVGWYEVEAQTWRNNRVARYWTGDGWSLTTTGPGNSIEFDNIRFIGK